VGQAFAAVGDQVGLVDLLPGVRTTRALTVSPHFSSGTPITATSATAGWEQGVLDLDRGDVLAAGDDHVLLAVGDRQVVLVVDHAAVAGVEPVVGEGGRRWPRARPVAREHDVAAGQDLAVFVDAEGDAEGGRAGAAELLGARVGSSSSHSARRRLKVSSGEVSVRP
jgi:hypothetical protein